jgi:exodeoxyribonuclease V alpha subunit
MNWPDAESLPDLSDHQREQYAAATGSGGCLSLLGGRPGTGKTFSLARILSKIPVGRFRVAAPTGKAAVRITESLQKTGVKNILATTIHSLLGPTNNDDGWSFEHNEENPLDLDWIFVDEASMLDTFLAGSLLASRPSGCRVMLIGDVNQLAPVGVGAPLRDLIAAGLPYGELTEIRRNAGRIVRCCHGIVDKHIFEPSPALDLAAESPENLLHIEKRDPEQQIEILKTMLEKFRLGAKVGDRHVNPTWDCQVLVPVNEKSPLARKRINTILQGFLNPGGDTVVGNQFRVGDKIVCSKNGWIPAETNIPRDMQGLRGADNQIVVWNLGVDPKKGKVYVANGEQAKVVAVSPNWTVARLWTPDRIVRIPKGKSEENDEGESSGNGCDWELAYALSGHKSQGSQWPVVITMADASNGARMVCDRCWIYTTLSRAETLAVTIGQRETIDDMCLKSNIWSRKTFLKETILDLKQAAVVQKWEAALT